MKGKVAKLIELNGEIDALEEIVIRIRLFMNEYLLDQPDLRMVDVMETSAVLARSSQVQFIAESGRGGEDQQELLDAINQAIAAIRKMRLNAEAVERMYKGMEWYLEERKAW